MFNADKYVNTLIDLGINEREFLGLYLAYIKRPDLAKKYSDECLSGMKIIPPIQMKELEAKGYVVKMPTGFVLSKKFMELFIDKHIATEEVFAIYPTFLYHQGAQIPLTAMDRNVFANLYIGLINGSIDEHKEVLLDIKFGIEQGLINIGIEKFLKSQHWKALREKRVANIIVQTTTTPIDYDF